MTGKEALEILKLQEEDKHRVELVNENNRQKRINQQARSKNPAKTNVKAKKTVVFRRETSRTIKMPRLLGESDSTGTESSESEYEDSDYICGKCAGVFVEEELWISCDSCSTWFHVKCTCLNKKTKGQIDGIKSWNCHVCCSDSKM